MDSINDLLSSLSDEDVANLREAAASLLGNREPLSTKVAPVAENQTFGGLDPVMIAKIGSVMNSMKSDDKRSLLIKAIKPYLSPERQKKCDEAVKILKLMSMLPLLREQNIF